MSGHALIGDSTFEGQHGVWAGVVGCECGWTGSVFGHPSKEAARSGLEAAWRDHKERVSPEVEEDS